MKSVVFISSLVNEADKDFINYSFAGQLYQQKVIRAYNFSKIFSFNVHSKPYDSVIGQDNILYYQYQDKKWLRYFDVIQFIGSINRQIPANTDIIFYNLTTRNFLPLIFFKYIRRLKVFVLLADYGSPKKSLLNYFLNILLRKADGLFVLSRNININRNSVFQELLIETFKPVSIAEEKNIEHNILFSGSIGKTTGIHIAIKAMQFLPQYQLHISGNLFDLTPTDLKEMLSTSNSNVHYHGALDRNSYLKLLDSCKICLSLRDIYNDDHLYNFPSKIGEYLSHNKVVISSLMYPGFEKYLHLTDWTPESLADTIIEIKSFEEASDWTEENFGFDKFKYNLNQLLQNAKKG